VGSRENYPGQYRGIITRKFEEATYNTEKLELRHRSTQKLLVDNMIIHRISQ
jgi:hypothetical protein